MRKLFNKYEKTMKKLFAKNREPRTRENTTFQKKTSESRGSRVFQKYSPFPTPPKLPQVNEPPQTHRNLRDPRTRVVHANSAVSTRSRLVIKFTQECEALVAGSY